MDREKGIGTTGLLEQLLATSKAYCSGTSKTL